MDNDLPRLERLQSILTLLQSGRLITSTQLSEKFRVSKRTIYRDIKSLENAGTPIITVEGRGYQLMEGYTLPPIMFSEEEALALITAHKLISINKDRSLKDNHEKAIEKIRAILRTSSKKKAEMMEERIVSLHNLPRLTTSDYVATMQQAILDRIVLDIKYQSLGKSETTQRKIEPMAMYHTKDNWILIAWCRLRNGYREFRLDCILSVAKKTDIFPERPFDLLSYFLDRRT